MFGWLFHHFGTLRWSYLIAQNSLKLMICLYPFPTCCDCRPVPPYLARFFCFLKYIVVWLQISHFIPSLKFLNIHCICVMAGLNESTRPKINYKHIFTRTSLNRIMVNNCQSLPSPEDAVFAGPIGSPQPYRVSQTTFFLIRGHVSI